MTDSTNQFQVTCRDAAPDLYEALRQVFRYGWTDATREVGRAALAKARGETASCQATVVMPVTDLDGAA